MMALRTTYRGSLAKPWCSAWFPHPFPGAVQQSNRSPGRKGDIPCLYGRRRSAPTQGYCPIVEKLYDGFDMVVGARQLGSQGRHRAVANDIFSKLATWMIQQSVGRFDVRNSRGTRAKHFQAILVFAAQWLLVPDSHYHEFFVLGMELHTYPFMRQTHSWQSPHQPHARRHAVSGDHLQIGAPYSGKLFLPVSLAFFCTALGYYGYTFLTQHRFSNMTYCCSPPPVLVFLIGLDF